MAAKFDSTNPKVYCTFGNLFIAVKDYRNAIPSFDRAIQLNPNYAEAYNNRAYAKVLSGDYIGTVIDCHNALRVMAKSPSPITYNNLGRAFRELNQLDSAFKYFDKAISINPNFAEGYFERGMAKHQQLNLDGACEDWNKARNLGYSDSTNMIGNNCTPK